MRERWNKYYADAIHARASILRQLPLAGRGLVATLIVVDLVVGLLPVLFVVASSVVVGRVPQAVAQGLGSPAWGSLVTAFLLASAAFIGQQLLTPLQSSLGELVKQRVDGQFHRRLITAALQSTGIAPMEDSATLDRLQEAAEQLANGFRTPGDAAAGILRYLTRYLSLAGYVAIVGGATSWWAAAALLVSTMTFRYGHRSGLRVWTKLWPVIGPHRREQSYFLDVGLYGAAAKELRVFGLTDWIVGRFRAACTASLKPLWKARRWSHLYKMLIFAAAGLVLDSAAMAYIVHSAAQGRLTLTELALGLQAGVAAILLGTFYHEADTGTQFGMNAVAAMEEFEQRVADYAAADIQPGQLDDARGLPRHGVRFDGVSFAYAGSTRPVLDGLNLTLNAGECTAIVGLNGAGKTTLVKLLARLYEPTEGHISVDGRDIRDLTVAAWRRQIGVIFQDFTRYEFSVTDNIAVGAIHRPIDPQAIRNAADKAGMTQTIDALPRGFETVLARQYDDGADLSGGQWQRIAIARALYAVDAGATVLVLDEPTAALDVRAEAEFFDNFVEMTRGVTSVLISHRFSSVRRADRIVVLDDGHVIEDGTHDSLLASGGRYADLFLLQAERFAAGLEADDADNDDREAVR
ncbi:MAG: ATP-binding cassette, subfamily bacterial [Frankiaceae bacterium]|nr:ATP-binding cassette, subfamily bacterial [Frankiaceae bacterium]